MIKIKTPLTNKKTVQLKAGDQILLSGVIYTARDQGHKRLVLLKVMSLPLMI
jgi:fumarate hydratase subunit beta